MKRWVSVLIGLVALAGGAAAGAWVMRGEIATALMRHAYERAMSRDPLAELPDGLHVGLCGAGSPMPDPARAGPCVAVVAGRQLFVVNSGPGSTRRLQLMQLPPAQVSAVFLTHFHSDHIGDLGELMLQHWGGGATTTPLPIYGPTGVDQMVAGFEQAYSLDRGYRVAHHGPKVMPPTGWGGVAHPFAISKTGPNVVVLSGPDLTVTAFPVDHEPVEPAVGYLFVYKGRRLVVSGDTAPSPRLEAVARGADVLTLRGPGAGLGGGAARGGVEGRQVEHRRHPARHPLVPHDAGGGGRHRPARRSALPALRPHHPAVADHGAGRPVPRPRTADLPRAGPGRPGRRFRQHAGWRDANQLYQPPTQHLVGASCHPAWMI